MTQRKKSVLTKVATFAGILVAALTIVAATLPVSRSCAIDFVDNRVEETVGNDIKLLRFMMEDHVGKEVVDSAETKLHMFLNKRD